MTVPELYRPSEADIDALLATYPLAQVISSGSTPMATPLPMLLRRAPSGDRLVGHFARTNPQVQRLREDPRALFVFMGPHGYVSPSWLNDRTQAPTWNFASVQITADVSFLDGSTPARRAVEALTTHMEAERPSPWSPAELGGRYEGLARGVLAFEAAIVSVVAKFKLGQNERVDVLSDILVGLRATGQAALLDATLAANWARLPEPTRSALGRDSTATIGV